MPQHYSNYKNTQKETEKRKYTFAELQGEFLRLFFMELIYCQEYN
jgi:hypothetical protein